MNGYVSPDETRDDLSLRVQEGNFGAAFGLWAYLNGSRQLDSWTIETQVNEQETSLPASPFASHKQLSGSTSNVILLAPTLR
jgi:hypothetical protein